MYYHASRTGDIKKLEPRISNHGVPFVYFSTKPENTLVYLSNAVEKFCKETGFCYDGTWEKWATYGFDNHGTLILEEYASCHNHPEYKYFLKAHFEFL